MQRLLKPARCTLILCLLLASLLLATSCGIQPIKTNASETPANIIIDAETLDLNPIETVLIENDGNLTGSNLTWILEDGSYLDYNFEPSTLPEGHLNIRVQYEEGFLDCENIGDYVFYYSPKAGEVGQFPLLAHNGFAYDGLDVEEYGYSKGCLTVNPADGSVSWQKAEFSAYQKWVHGDDGIIRLYESGTPYDGWMLYLDPENGPCLSQTEYTAIQVHHWKAEDIPGYVPEVIDLEALGLPVPEVYVPAPILEME